MAKDALSQSLRKVGIKTIGCKSTPQKSNLYRILLDSSILGLSAKWPPRKYS